MNDMIRYSIVKEKNPREIVLLKGGPCVWGKCAFCDYILDNETEEEKMIVQNGQILNQITGAYGALEIINSGSAFELPQETLQQIKKTIVEKKIERLFLECYWAYRKRLDELREYFGIPIIFKCGIETFDNAFRNQVLKKGFVIKDALEVANYFASICLLVGVQGQTKEMIDRDLALLQQHFSYGCVNIFVENSTPIKADPAITAYFKENYSYLVTHPTIEVLWNNTDFGVGGDAV